VELRVSPPLAHGLDGTPLGYVVALTVEDHTEGERFVFASDVQGPLSPVALAYLLRERPTLLYLSGPPSYMERELGTAAIDRGVQHLRRIIDATGCRVIMDHHALRDVRAETRFAALWESGRVVTAARYLGVPEVILEGRRPQLWAGTRKPAARAGGRRATIGSTAGKLAQGRSRE
jgi:predicted metallo-beta-lactamase superfamily hydrolase